MYLIFLIHSLGLKNAFVLPIQSLDMVTQSWLCNEFRPDKIFKSIVPEQSLHIARWRAPGSTNIWHVRFRWQASRGETTTHQKYVSRKEVTLPLFVLKYFLLDEL